MLQGTLEGAQSRDDVEDVMRSCICMTAKEMRGRREGTARNHVGPEGFRFNSNTRIVDTV